MREQNIGFPFTLMFVTLTFVTLALLFFVNNAYPQEESERVEEIVDEIIEEMYNGEQADDVAFPFIYRLAWLSNSVQTLQSRVRELELEVQILKEK